MDCYFCSLFFIKGPTNFLFFRKNHLPNFSVLNLGLSRYMFDGLIERKTKLHDQANAFTKTSPTAIFACTRRSGKWVCQAQVYGITNHRIKIKKNRNHHQKKTFVHIILDLRLVGITSYTLLSRPCRHTFTHGSALIQYLYS